MNSKLWIQKALTTCSLMALIASYSMVALATAPASSGELIVSGSAGETSFVTVNGEPAKSGRTVFSSSTISTPDGMNATLNLGKAGKVAFGPNTTFSVSFDESAITGTLTSGNLTVLGATQPVEIKTLDRGVVRANAGETVSATATALRDDTRDSTGKCIDSDNDGKLECDEGGNWLVWGIVVAGAIAGLIFIATADNDADIGSGAGTVSPTR
jgi:hypothetical protein